MGLFMYQNRDVREIGMAYLSQRFVVSTVSYLHTFGLDKATDLPKKAKEHLLDEGPVRAEHPGMVAAKAQRDQLLQVLVRRLGHVLLHPHLGRLEAQKKKHMPPPSKSITRIPHYTQLLMHEKRH